MLTRKKVVNSLSHKQCCSALFICFIYLFNFKGHYDVCKKYPMVCLQRCGEHKIPRDKVNLYVICSNILVPSNCHYRCIEYQWLNTFNEIWFKEHYQFCRVNWIEYIFTVTEKTETLYLSYYSTALSFRT